MQARIMEAAQELFLKKGFENVSMRAIAARIGYSPGAIYRYFKNKKEILSVLRHEAFGEFLDQLRSVDPGLPPLERVRILMTMYYRFAVADPDMFDLMFHLGPSSVGLGGKWAQRPREVYDHFCSEIDACQRSGSFPGADTQTVVLSLWSGVHGYATLAAKKRLQGLVTGFAVDTTGEAVVNFLLGTR